MAVKATEPCGALRLFLSLIALASACGNAPPSEPSRRINLAQERSPGEQARTRTSVSRGVVCDRFELRYELVGSDLLLWIDTDLPDEGELSVTVDRQFYEVGVSDAYSREYFHRFEPVSRWREPRRISLNAESWKANLREHQNKMASIGDRMAFEIARIEDSIGIRAILHLIQDDPRFGGRGNPNLSGKATSSSGNTGVLVEAEEFVEFPLAGPPPGSRSVRASYDGLESGESYRLSNKTPLMPVRFVSGRSFEESKAAIGETRYLPAGTVIHVKVADHGSTSWYQVEVHSHWGVSGWINSTALIGQEIDRID